MNKLQQEKTKLNLPSKKMHQEKYVLKMKAQGCFFPNMKFIAPSIHVIHFVTAFYKIS